MRLIEAVSQSHIVRLIAPLNHSEPKPFTSFVYIKYEMLICTIFFPPSHLMMLGFLPLLLQMRMMYVSFIVTYIRNMNYDLQEILTCN